MTQMLRAAIFGPRNRFMLLAASLALFLLYTFFDLREGGRETNLLTTALATPAFYIEAFGGWFFWSSVVLNLALAIASALLIVVSWSAYRQRRARMGGACSTTATLLFGFAFFGCPGCIMPLFGSLGLAVFANTLPLLGLEFKLLALAVVIATLVWIHRTQAHTDGSDIATAMRSSASSG